VKVEGGKWVGNAVVVRESNARRAIQRRGTRVVMDMFEWVLGRFGLLVVWVRFRHDFIWLCSMLYVSPSLWKGKETFRSYRSENGRGHSP
jgi:hypothetical protein